MQLQTLKALDTGRRVQACLDAQAAAIGTTVPATLRAQLDAAVNQLAAYQIEQGTTAGTAVGETSNQVAIRRDINERLLRPIARVAEFALADVPDFSSLFVPSGSIRAGDFAALLTALADTAMKYEKVFVEHGVPADFIAQLRAAATQFSSSTESRGRHLSRRSAATAGLKAAEKTVRKVIGVLNAVLTPLLKTNPALLADWTASRRIPATIVNPNPSGDGGDSTGAIAPVAAPAQSAA